jgi:hypothetical protein
MFNYDSIALTCEDFTVITIDIIDVKKFKSSALTWGSHGGHYEGYGLL